MPPPKAQKAKYATFASQFRKAFELFCKEHDVLPDFQDYELLKGFYTQKSIAKVVNQEIKTKAKREKRRIVQEMTTRVRPSKVRFNKGFHLIDEDCLYGQEPVSDKTQIREPKYLTIQ